MTTEGSGGNKFAQLVTDHVFGDVDRHMTATVMHSDGVTDEGGENGRCAGPGLEDLLFAVLVELFYALEQL